VSSPRVVTRRREEDLVTETITDQDAWYDALTDVCGLPLQLSVSERGTLWASVVAGHQRWLDSQDH
jgi:hypothetical protein